MLACLVGITAVAMQGSSWSAIVEKFKKIELPSVLIPESASRQSENSGSGGGEASRTSPRFKMAEAPKYRPAVLEPVPTIEPPELTEPPVASASVPTPPAERNGYQDVQDRLQSLGATYYLLESWGNRQELYRFQCKVAVDGNVDYTHYFEATDADPLQAMLQVLRQVEHWREG